MNRWIKASIRIANNRGYLDNLHAVYPVTLGVQRAISRPVLGRLKRTYNGRNKAKLIHELMAFEKFPVKDPYVAFLRKNDAFLRYNPKTVSRIADRLFAIGFKKVVEGLTEAKEFNRQIGALFKQWLPKIGYPVLPRSAFDKHGGIVFLAGSDRDLKDYANKVLGCRLWKAPDMIAKVRGQHIIGETKFITDFGGHQYGQFEQAPRLAIGRAGKAKRIAIFDGVLWVSGNSKMHKTIQKFKGAALTALLLKQHLKSLK